MLEHHHTSPYWLHILALQKLFKLAEINLLTLTEVGFEINLFMGQVGGCIDK